MPIDYLVADQVAELSFKKLDKPTASLGFPNPGTLANHLNALLDPAAIVSPTLSDQHRSLFASAGVEMWHRAIHSFLWSVALSNSSPIWASVSGYYASHFVMRGFANSMGIFKSFRRGKAVQVVLQNKSWVFLEVPGGGEHGFYWKVVKDHPSLSKNPLFRENHEGEDKQTDMSDAAHRNFANYTDHIARFEPPKFCSIQDVTERVERISRVNRHYPTAPTPQRKRFADVATVQVLAYQRIVTFREFFDSRFTNNRFWKAHRKPSWCSGVIDFEISGDGLLEGKNELLKPETDLASLS